jgi:hypothetical protein
MLPRWLALATLVALAVSTSGSVSFAADDARPAPSASIVVTGAEPERYVLYNTSFNAFDDIERSYRPQLDNAMKAQGLQLGRDFQAAIAERLSRLGHAVEVKEIAHRAFDEPLRPEAVANVGADIVVDVVFEHAQYANTPFSRALRPDIWLRVRAIDVRARKYLFKERFTYDGHNSPIVTINVEPDPKYDFKSEAALFVDPAFTAEGFRAAAPLIADQVAILFAKLDQASGR